MIDTNHSTYVFNTQTTYDEDKATDKTKLIQQYQHFLIVDEKKNI